jgi:hypothetical protein
MFKERDNLKEYTFVKCIKATTRVEKPNLIDRNYSFKMTQRSEITDKSNPVLYNDKFFEEQLTNLGISLILSIEPKKKFTVFKKNHCTLAEITKLHGFIVDYYFKKDNIFIKSTSLTEEEKQKIGNEYYLTFKYYEHAIQEFTIKQFLENLFRLYDIIPMREEL